VSKFRVSRSSFLKIVWIEKLGHDLYHHIHVEVEVYLINYIFVLCLFVWLCFKATFNTISVISWRSVLLVEETGVPGENRRPVTSQWQTLSQCCTPRTHRDSNSQHHMIGTDYTGRSIYHTNTTTTAPVFMLKFGCS
jgi:ABC-type dipeptide/oligopeptide/nickel transport system permease subunit